VDAAGICCRSTNTITILIDVIALNLNFTWVDVEVRRGAVVIYGAKDPVHTATCEAVAIGVEALVDLLITVVIHTITDLNRSAVGCGVVGRAIATVRVAITVAVEGRGN
tara:strand:+ start:4974 stop:5300 length:327 start_codon:yes stop_codon:yes gene_type:complete